MVEEHCRGSGTEGAVEGRRENAGMSSERKVGILPAEYPRFPGKADLLWVSRGLRRGERRSRWKQVEIPVPRVQNCGDTCGKGMPGRKDRRKRGREMQANPHVNPGP